MSQSKELSRIKVPSFLLSICSIPWLVAYYIFAFANPDPEHCWTDEDSFTAYAEKPDILGSIDMAQEWRKWFRVMFSIYCVTASIPFLAGIFACRSPKTRPIVICLYIGFILSLFAKGIVFWWGVFIRYSDHGRVAAGSMVSDCIALEEPEESY